MEKEEQLSKEVPLWQLTVGEFETLIEKLIRPRTEDVRKAATDPTDKILVGIQGLASYLEVSRATAQNYKSSGILDGSYTQIGRTIRFNADLVDEAIKKHRNNL